MFAVTRKFEAVKETIDKLNCTVLFEESFGHLTLAKMIKTPLKNRTCGSEVGSGSFYQNNRTCVLTPFGFF